MTMRVALHLVALLIALCTVRGSEPGMAAIPEAIYRPVFRGDKDAKVRELAALLGVNYAEDSRGQFAHTNLFTLLNADGEIAFQHTGLKQDPALLVAAIAKAASGAQR